MFFENKTNKTKSGALRLAFKSYLPLLLVRSLTLSHPTSAYMTNLYVIEKIKIERSNKRNKERGITSSAQLSQEPTNV